MKNVLIFEYAIGSKDDLELSILEEGYSMYKKLVMDFLNNGYNIYTILDNGKLKSIGDNLNIEKHNAVIFKPSTDIFTQIDDILSNYTIDYALIIAPECDNLLYDLTKIVEKNKVKNLGCSSESIRICGNKYLTYLKIKDYVNIPTTMEPKKYVIKDINGCGGFHKIVDNNSIIQEYIEGEHYSLSLIVQNNGNNINNNFNKNNHINKITININNRTTTYYTLSLNRQIIKNYYMGGITNIDHPLKEKIIYEVIKGLSQIEGLNGYVGVDIIISKNNDIYLLEINPRITTSIIGINTEPNLGQLLIDNANKKPLKYSLNNSVEFIREDGKFKLKVLK